MTCWLTLVGIGEDGYAGLGEAARLSLEQAKLIIGSPRQLALLPEQLRAERETWPSPFSLQPVLARRGSELCVLASGDPMFYGVGASLARELLPEEMHVLPAPSSVSLAAARLGWVLQDVCVASLVGRPLTQITNELAPGARLLILSNDQDSPSAVAELLRQRGLGASRLTVLEHLGGPAERILDGLADDWGAVPVAALNVVAIECIAQAQLPSLPLTCGLADECYQHDGQLTKRDVRAVTLARLAPLPGELLWDVGAGCGSIGIEWMRADSRCQAIAIEANACRHQHILHNRDALGVPGLQLVSGRAPEALRGLQAPDAIFIGGGVTVEGVLDTCWAALKPGGRLVANAVTLQSEAALVAWRAKVGGSLTRLSVVQAQPLGGFDTWRAALPITLLESRKP
ncbi:precorrin-6y C5,15-methyltransferase (decarboxylating) subunit CbiE [Pseudomonas profundi]|uniref:precorrin-6y C5,15-methyltransferase (decarboxylating) subunit CbiE n=1 Tax=Pseudomonas profundi TaxID=1981513 RepID=UPI00123940B6|nr:precorrin-6y C5,15-methyltransferase (decarboxylating) subunit CbiE [Pseudomonas profundi]